MLLHAGIHLDSFEGRREQLDELVAEPAYSITNFYHGVQR